MARTIVGVLRGGTSSEYDLSLKSGAAVLAALPEEKYETRDIFVDKNGYWHLRGIPVEAPRALSQVDVVVNALHGGVGEDGAVQRILERSGIRYAGSRPLPSALSLNKSRGVELLRGAGVEVPRTIAFNVGNDMTTADMARAAFASFGPPYIVKPAAEGAGHGVSVAFTISELPDRIGDALDEFGSALVQEYLQGREASVGVIEDFRGQELYALPPARVILPEGERFLGRDHHERALARYLVPSDFSDEEKRALEAAARKAHSALGLSHFSRADLMLARGKAYVLETNAIPGLYPGASFPLMLESVGSSTREFLEHAIALARN